MAVRYVQTVAEGSNEPAIRDMNSGLDRDDGGEVCCRGDRRPALADDLQPLQDERAVGGDQERLVLDGARAEPQHRPNAGPRADRERPPVRDHDPVTDERPVVADLDGVVGGGTENCFGQRVEFPLCYTLAAHEHERPAPGLRRDGRGGITLYVDPHDGPVAASNRHQVAIEFHRLAVLDCVQPVTSPPAAALPAARPR